MSLRLLSVVALSLLPLSASAAVKQFGDRDLSNTGTYGTDPTTGTALSGLAPNVLNVGSSTFTHTFPFSPVPTDFPGTDQIYVGSNQTATHDGYAGSSLRISAPQTLSLDYADLIPPGETISTFTLGIMADDFQFPSFFQPYTVTVNGVNVPALTAALNNINETGPSSQFLSIGLDPALLSNSNILTLTINQAGDGGDGWSVDFLTVGVTTGPLPEPTALSALLPIIAVATRRRR